jgi:hypothetical protein
MRGKLDCGDSSCQFAVNKSGMRTNGGCSCIEKLVDDATMFKARVAELEQSLTKISDIRDSIVGTQNINWSEHIYPLVATLDGAGFSGKGYEIARKNIGTLLDRNANLEKAGTDLVNDLEGTRDSIYIQNDIVAWRKLTE